MLRVECKLFHSKKETDEEITSQNRARSLGNAKSTISDGNNYKPLGTYNTFSSFNRRGSSIVLLREPILGKTIEEFFQNERKSKQFHKVLDSYARVFDISKIYQPHEE